MKYKFNYARSGVKRHFIKISILLFNSPVTVEMMVFSEFGTQRHSLVDFGHFWCPKSMPCTVCWVNVRFSCNVPPRCQRLTGQAEISAPHEMHGGILDRIYAIWNCTVPASVVEKTNRRCRDAVLTPGSSRISGSASLGW